jgi:hypothetical protein
MYLELILLGLVSMAAPWLARLTGLEVNRKPFDFCEVAGIFFLLTAGLSFGVTLFPAAEAISKWLMAISFVLGNLGLLTGGVWGAVDVLREPSHTLASAERKI